MSLPGRSAAPLECACAGPDHPVRLTRAPESLILDNGLVRVLIGDDGNLHRVRDLVDGRDLLLPGQCANRLVMHPDHPSCFDAWELQEHYRHDHLPLDAAESIDIAVDSPLRARVRVLRSFGSSRAEQTITLDADSRAVDLALDIDWQERARVLKVDFPLAVRATRSIGEIQFGSIERPLAPNTSWDQARFETSAHRWLLLAEPGYAVALINESSYGHDVGPHGGGPTGPTSGVSARLTLLRSPQAPDPQADRGRHLIRYSLLAGADRTGARQTAERLNEPVRLRSGAVEMPAPARLEGGTPTQ